MMRLSLSQGRFAASTHANHMKPNLPLLLLCIVLLVLTQAQAQVSIPASRFTQSGWTLYEAYDDQFIELHNGFAGGNQQINLSTLRNVNIDTLQLLPVAQAPFGAQLPGNLALVRNGGRSGTQYFEIDQSGWKIHGFIDQQGFINQNFGPAELIRFPITTGQQFTNPYVNRVQFYVGQALNTPYVVDSVRRRTYNRNFSQITGWGQLTTPLGTHPVLVQALSNRLSDTADFKRADNGQWVLNAETQEQFAVTYLFWSDAQPWPLAELTDIDSIGLIERALWLSGGLASSLAENTRLQARIGPNPAADWLYISGLEAPTSYHLYDVQGKEIASGELYAQEKNPISLLAYQNGTYLLVLEAARGRLFTKLTLQK
jgi:hypothetical protein